MGLVSMPLNSDVLPVGLSPRIFRGKCERVVGVTQRTLRIIVSDNFNWLHACRRLNYVCLCGQKYYLLCTCAILSPRAARMRRKRRLFMKLSGTRRKPVGPRLHLRGNFDSDLRAARARGETHRELSRDPFKKTQTLKDAELLLKGYTSRGCGARAKKLKGTRSEETSAGCRSLRLSLSITQNEIKHYIRQF